MYNSFYHNPDDFDRDSYQGLIGLLVDMARGNPHKEDPDEIREHIQQMYDDGELSPGQFARLSDLLDEV